MAAGVPLETNVSRLPSGVAQFTFIGAGAAAGAQTVSGIKAARDVLMQATLLVLSGVLVKSFADYTNEFYAVNRKNGIGTTDNALSNTGGTSLAGGILFVTVARGKPA